MARRKSKKSRAVTKANRQITVQIPAGESYVDVARCLSMINRKLFAQGKVYGIESVDFMFTTSATAAVQRLSAFTAGDTWSVHNAHTKGKALWNEMQQLVLADNPSIAGTWHDYKVYLDKGQAEAAAPVQNLNPIDGGSVQYQQGEWTYSTYVMPQHVVDAATGQPLVADETTAHLLGANVGVAGAFTSVGLVKAYQESRATVQEFSPDVPAGFSESFFNLLTDSGSQEPELGDVIEGENDSPPYDQNQYPGGAFNAVNPVYTEFTQVSDGYPTGTLTSFVAQCGLIKFENTATITTGESTTAPTLLARITVMPGKYKGVAAIDMGQ